MSKSPASTIQAANTALIVNGELDAIGEFFTPDYIAHVTGRDITGGHVAIRKILDTYYRAFTNMNVDVEILLESTDRIAWQRTMRATHTGNFKGFPATNQEITWRDMIVSRFDGDRIAEEWVSGDLAEQLLSAGK